MSQTEPRKTIVAKTLVRMPSGARSVKQMNCVKDTIATNVPETTRLIFEKVRKRMAPVPYQGLAHPCNYLASSKLVSRNTQVLKQA